jgi:phage/plasmid-associated DNA primase
VTSSFPVKKIESRSEDIISCWHQEGKVNSDLHFYHEYDFYRYWFEPLGRVFGISAKQVEELATMVVVEEWKTCNNVMRRIKPA